jgi:hypothetical protein
MSCSCGVESDGVCRMVVGRKNKWRSEKRRVGSKGEGDHSRFYGYGSG